MTRLWPEEMGALIGVAFGVGMIVGLGIVGLGVVSVG